MQKRRAHVPVEKKTASVLSTGEADHRAVPELGHPGGRVWIPIPDQRRPPRAREGRSAPDGAVDRILEDGEEIGARLGTERAEAQAVQEAF